MNNNPLVSIIIISYNNYEYIYKAIDSIILQDYPNIELIISNDGSPDFDKKAIEKYLKKNSKKNIKNTIINNNKKNVGTVKNVNIAIKLSRGEYIILFAADDVIYNKNVVSNFIKAFQSLPEKELIVTSQIGMYDVNLKRLIQPFVSKKHINLITTLKPDKLFSEMATKCIIPGCGNCYKRKIFEKYGYFDEKYVLVEDYSSALKFSRLGIRFNYSDFISFKHRDGGISHGNIGGKNKKSQQYKLDIINILKNEVLPYTKYLNKKQLHNFTKRYNHYLWQYSYKYNFINGTKQQKRLFIKKNLITIILNFSQDLFRDIIDQFTGKKAKLCLLGIILYFFGSYIRIIGLLAIFTAISLSIFYLIKKYLPKLIRLLKFIL